MTPYDISMFDVAIQALFMIAEPQRLMYLSLGVLVGLAIGLLPGIGGLTGFALLIPFTYTMDPVTAFAMLIGMAAVTATSDTIPAVLFGVPGTASSQATVLDGMPMTQKGEAGRALSAAYLASVLGGLFGAVALAFSLPLVRPFVLSIGSPEMLAMSVFGIAMVAALSGNTPMRGIVAAGFGILVGMIGTDVQTGTLRWTGDVLYLWDGVTLLPILLGLFALPELCDLAVKRGALTDNVKFSAKEGMLLGIKDVVQNWFLILRCGSLGALLGAIPGISGSVTDWFAYGHAIRTEKGAAESFSKGDVRGVIAPESANNARDGGALVPTLAFGVPGSASMAILLGALMVHGFTPGPDMLTVHLDITYSMVWSIAIANILGAGLCFLLSGQFAKVSMLRYTLILPVILPIVYVGAFQGSRNWGDLVVLLLFGALGWIMKRLQWPRPPVILGLVLGALIERYLSISVARFGLDWLQRPAVIILFTLAFLALVRPLFDTLRHEGFKVLVPRGRISLRAADAMYAFFIAVPAVMIYVASDWPSQAMMAPTVVGVIVIVCGLISFSYKVFARNTADVPDAATKKRGIYMDLRSEELAIDSRTVLARGGQFFAWFIVFLLTTALVGLIPAVVVFVVAYMRVEGRERWRFCFLYALSTAAFIFIVFDQIMHVPWPRTVLGHFFPALTSVVPSL